MNFKNLRQITEHFSKIDENLNNFFNLLKQNPDLLFVTISVFAQKLSQKKHFNNVTIF